MTVRKSLIWNRKVLNHKVSEERRMPLFAEDVERFLITNKERDAQPADILKHT